MLKDIYLYIVIYSIAFLKDFLCLFVFKFPSFSRPWHMRCIIGHTRLCPGLKLPRGTR